MPAISVICPIYKSDGIIKELVDRVREVLVTLTQEFEIILVEDGSPDLCWPKIVAECERDNRVKGIKLSRNFGQQIAVSAGLRYCNGDIIVIMDGDLQNPPQVIPELISKIKEGYDIVYTVSSTRNNWQDEVTSRMFWFVINKIFRVGIVPNQLMLKAFNKSFVNNYNIYNENVRVVAGIAHDIGMKKAVLKVDNQKRKQGTGNYSFFKRFHLMVDVVLTMTNAPLNYLINLSLFSLFITILIGLWNLINYFFYSNIPPGYTTIVLLILFFGTLTTFIMGIIGRYLSNIYVEVRRRPMFLVQSTENITYE